MHPVIQKQTQTALHILDLILDCGKSETGVIRTLAEAFTQVVPNNTAINAGILGDSLKDLRALCVEGDKTCTGAPLDDSNDAAGTPVIQIPEPTLPVATPAPAKKVAAKKAAAPAPVTEPAPAPAQPAPPAALPEESHDLPEEQGITPEAAERLRTLIRDTFTARSKKIAAEGDPNNEKKQAYTSAFTTVVKSFGADTVTLTDNSKLQAMLDAVRAL